MFILEAIGAFFAAIFRGIWFAICWIARMIVQYFIVYLPVLIMGGFAIFWILTPDGPQIEGITTFDVFNTYNYKFTVMCAEWLINNPEPVGLITLLLIIVFFLFKLVLLIVVALLETAFVYVLFGLVGSFVLIVLQLVLVVVIFFVLPGAAVVYSGIFIKYSDYLDRWFYILCALLTLACSVTCYIYAFAAV